MSDKVLERYVELKEQIGKLEDELEGLKEKVFQVVEASKDNRLEFGAFTFKSQKRPKYKFSAEYEAKDRELKALKKSEIEDEIATIEGYSEYVTLKPNK